MQYIDKVGVNPELAIVFLTVGVITLITCIVLWSWRGKDLWGAQAL